MPALISRHVDYRVDLGREPADAPRGVHELGVDVDCSISIIVPRDDRPARAVGGDRGIRLIIDRSADFPLRRIPTAACRRSSPAGRRDRRGCHPATRRSPRPRRRGRHKAPSRSSSHRTEALRSSATGRRPTHSAAGRRPRTCPGFPSRRRPPRPCRRRRYKACSDNGSTRTRRSRSPPTAPFPRRSRAARRM